MTVGEIDVFFVEDGCPLEWCSMKLLTGCAVAVLGIQGLFPTQLVLDFATMTAGFIASVKIWIIVVNLVRRSELPLVVLPFSTPLIAIVTVGAVCRCLFSHVSSTGVILKYTDIGEYSKRRIDRARCKIQLTGA